MPDNRTNGGARPNASRAEQRGPVRSAVRAGYPRSIPATARIRPAAGHIRSRNTVMTSLPSVPAIRPGRLLRHEGGKGMTKNRVALLAILLIAGVSHADDSKPKDKNAPTTFATNVGCTIPPVVPEPCSTCNTCNTCKHSYDCLIRVKHWLCFVPLRTCPCECKHCSGCYPPLYVYFLMPCVEGAPCAEYSNHCASCVTKTCAAHDGVDFYRRLFHSGCTSGCDTCK
jgi:hypothetical protein